MVKQEERYNEIGHEGKDASMMVAAKYYDWLSSKLREAKWGAGNLNMETWVEKNVPTAYFLSGKPLIKEMLRWRKELDPGEIFEYLLSRFGRRYYQESFDMVRNDLSDDLRERPLSDIKQLEEIFSIQQLDDQMREDIRRVQGQPSLTNEEMDEIAQKWMNLFAVRDLIFKENNKERTDSVLPTRKSVGVDQDNAPTDGISMRGGQLEKKDAALKTSPQVKGGIEFNSRDMNLTVKRDGQDVQMSVDQAQLTILQSGNFSGFVPKVINITPLSSRDPLFGS